MAQSLLPSQSIDYETFVNIDLEDDVYSPTTEEIQVTIDYFGIIFNMDNTGENLQIERDKNLNVELLSARGISGTQHPSDTSEIWVEHSTGDSLVTYDVVNRWFLMNQETWSTSQTLNTEVCTKYLPLDAIKDQSGDSCIKTPMTLIPFGMYAYWRGDIEIKVVLNSNRFQIGQLQVAWYYVPYDDLDKEMRDNIYSRSQNLHMILDASSSNEGILMIPFKYHRPYMPLFKITNDNYTHKLGFLQIRVLSPLQCPSSIAQSCELSIFVRFPNSRFTGQIFDISAERMEVSALTPYNEYQMFSRLGSIAKAAIAAAVKETVNCDKPSNVEQPPALVPWASHSWSAGTNCFEYTNMLRLDMTGQTEFGGITVDEDLTVRSIVGKYGLVGITKWSAAHKVGDVLMILEGSPTWSHEAYPIITAKSATLLETLALPPVSCVANLYTWWRGTIKFRFDFVCSPYHTGRLMFVIVPRYEKTITLDQAKNCPYVVFDLQDKRQFELNVPYIASQPWWPKRDRVTKESEDLTFSPPVRVHVFVLNGLIPMDAVAKTIFINVYMAGGDDFEVAVPCAPSIGLSINNKFFLPEGGGETVRILGGKDFYLGTWHSFYAAGNYRAILRWGTTSDAIAELSYSYQRAGYYVAKNQNIKDANNVAYPYLVPFTSGAYVYGAVFKTIDKAKKYATKRDPKDAEVYNGSGGPWVEDNDYFWTWVQTDDIMSLDSVSDIEYQMDQREQGDIPASSGIQVPSTSFGKQYFGENFFSLKDLCRRYQKYASISFEVNDRHFGGLQVPVCPQGLLLDVGSKNDIHEVNNRARDGVIPIVCDGFRFFRGSIRMRFVFNEDSINKVIFIQHRPDLLTKNHQIIPIQQPQTARDMLTSGYAFLYQGTIVNQIIEIEVPFYQPGMFGILHHQKKGESDEELFGCLGSLLIGSSTEGKITCDIFYSFADDMHLSVFQGFQPMIFTNEIPPIPVKIEYQMLDCEIHKIYHDTRVEHQMMRRVLAGAVEETARVAQDLIPEIEIPAMCGLAAYGSYRVACAIENSITSGIDKISDITNNVKDVADKVSQGAEVAPTILQNVVSTLGGNFISQAIISAFSNLIHVIINPTISTFVVSLTSFLSTMGVLVSDFIFKFSEACKKFLHWLTGIEHQAPGDNSTMASYLATLVCSIGFLFGKIFTPSDKTLESLSFVLLKGIKEFTMTANCLTIFIKNNINVVLMIFDWMMRKIDPGYNVVTTIVHESEKIEKWVRDVNLLTQYENTERIKTDPLLCNQVYENAAIAVEIMAGLSCIKNEVNVPVILNLCTKIIKVRDELVKYKVSPPVRFEPFVMYLYGAAGVGKSFLSEQIDVELLKHINYKTTSEVRFVVTPGNAYFNGVKNQPVCKFDDFQAVSGDRGDQEAGILFQLKSTAVFNPPIAELENKHIRYNPILVMVLSNHSHPKPTTVTHMPALWRRRDVLVRVTNIYGSLETARERCDVSKFEHLRFFVHRVVDDEKVTDGTNYNYKDFLELMKVRFAKYVREESINFQVRLETSRALFPTDDIYIDGTQDDLTQNLTRFQMDDLPPNQRVMVEAAVNLGREMHEQHDAVYGPAMEPNTLAVEHLSQEFSDLRRAITGHPELNTNCEHRRFIPNLWDFDHEEQYFSRGTDIVRLTSCGRGCAWEISPRLKDVSLEWWVRLNLSTLENIIEFMPTEIEIHYDRIKGRTAVSIFALHRMETWRRLYRKIIEKFKSSIWFIWDTLTRAYRMFLYILPYALAITGLSFGVHCAARALDNIFINSVAPRIDRTFGNEFQSVHTSGDIATRGARHTNTRITRDFFVRRPVEFQGEEIVDHLKKLMKRNSFILNAAGLKLNGVGIFGHFGVIPYHYIEFVLHGHYYVESMTMFEGSRIPIGDLDITSMETSGLCVVKFPPQVPPFKDIVKFFVRAGELKNLSNRGYLVQMRDYGLESVELDYGLSKQIKISGCDYANEFTLDMGAQYKYSRRGACGSVLLDSRNNHCVVAMHIAGRSDGTYGYGELLIYEKFARLYESQVVRDIDTLVEFQCIEPSENNILYGINVMNFGLVPRSLAHNETGKTKIVKSATYEQILPVMTEPGILTPNDERNVTKYSPMREGVLKQEVVPLNFDREDVALADRYISQLIIAKVKPLRQTVELLSEEEAVCGLWDIPEYECLEMSTSEAFPYTAFRPAGVQDKKWLLNLEDTQAGYRCHGFHELLRAIVDNKRELRLRGIIPETIFVNNLKQQCLTIENARKPGKVRIFNMSPLDFTIEMRIYTLDFIVAFHKAFLDVHHAIGIDVHSPDWMRLYTTLTEVGNNFIDGDYRAFGPTLCTEFVLKSFDLINKWYKRYSPSWKQEDDNIRVIMAHELAYAKYLAFQTLYMAFCGSPSGSAVTVDVNSIVNLYYIVTCIIHYMKTSQRPTLFGSLLEFMDQNIRFFVYGDDVIISVSDDVKDEFNLRFMEDYFASKNITFHSAEKDPSKTYLYRKPTEVTFLKASFVWNAKKKVMLAKLPLESISNSFNWVWTHPDMMRASLEAAESSMPLAIGWGEEFYEDLREKVEKFYNERGIIPRLNTWEEEIKNRYFK